MASSRLGRWFPVAIGLSLASAFVVPPRFTTPVRASVQGVFAPVSIPARAIAGAAYRRTHADRVTDDGSADGPRQAEVVVAENHALRAALASLEVKFEQLSQVDADRKLVGNIRPLCRPAEVTGADSSGLREALTVSGIDGSAVSRPVVHGTDLVGRVEAAGLTGAAVRLVTDPGFSFTARLARYVTDPGGGVALSFVTRLHPLVQGIGHGAMAIRNTVTMAQAADARLAVGDLVLLDDLEWQPNVQGFTAGRVTAITPQSTAPIFADIRVEPAVNLLRLNEVMVVVKN